MATLREIIYDIGDTIRGGSQTDDEPLTDRHKAFIVNSVRAMLVERGLNKGKGFDGQLEQPLDCENVIRVPTMECCGIELDVHVLRTCNQLPKFITSPYGISRPTYIGDVSGWGAFPYLEPHRVRHQLQDNFVKGLRFCTIINRFVYIFNDKELEKLQVRAIWENPYQIDSYPSGDDYCYNLDMEYPLPTSLIPVMKEMIYKLDINVLLRSMTDTTNDSNGAVNNG